MYDVIVIGGGPGGYKSAELLARGGLCVALVEKENVGGVCLNQGCIPFKTYLHSSKIIFETNKLFKEGLINKDPADIKILQQAVYDNKTRIVYGLNKSVENMLLKLGVTIYKGTAKAVSYNDSCVSFAVNEDVIEAKKCILALGSEEITINTLQSNEFVKIIHSKEMLELKEIPKSIDIVGGGVIGIEAATYFNEIGCETTLIEKTDHIAGNIDQDISISLAEILRKKGINVFTNTTFVKFDDDKAVYESNGEMLVRNPQYVMSAIGRKPNLDKQMLDTLKVDYNSSGVLIKDDCSTSNKNVYACGDITGKLMLAHVAYVQARVIADTLLNKSTESIDYYLVPKVIYSNPEVLSVGYTEQECQTNNFSYTCVTLPMTFSGKYFAENGKDGAKAKLIVNRDTQIIGFHMIGNGSSEMAIALEIAIKNKLTASDLCKLVYPHPTYAEIIYELALELDKK